MISRRARSTPRRTASGPSLANRLMSGCQCGRTSPEPSSNSSYRRVSLTYVSRRTWAIAHFAQIQRERKLPIDHWGGGRYGSRGVADAREARQATAFGLEGIDRKFLVTAAPRVDHVILASAHRAIHPA